MNFFGPHWKADLKGVERSKIEDLGLIKNYMLESVEASGMCVISGPHIFHYQHPVMPKENGVTGLLALADSHMSVHSFINDGWVFCDLFTCAEFDREVIEQIAIDTFKPLEYSFSIEFRGVGYERIRR